MSGHGRPRRGGRGRAGRGTRRRREEDAAAEFRQVVPRLQDVEDRVQPVARLIPAQLREQLGDRARLGVMPHIENGEDQIVLAFKVVVERLLLTPASVRMRSRPTVWNPSRPNRSYAASIRMCRVVFAIALRSKSCAWQQILTKGRCECKGIRRRSDPR